MGKRHNIMKKPLSVNKIQVWTVQNGTNSNSKLEASWKRPNSKLLVLQLTAKQKYLATLFHILIKEDQILEWLMAGVTTLIQKNENIEGPKNYKPVICLPTIYKTITLIIGK